MRVENLPSPGLLENGVRLRLEAAKALSSVDIAASTYSPQTYPTTGTPAQIALLAFFDQCILELAPITSIPA
jgi:hypothetical protein